MVQQVQNNITYDTHVKPYEHRFVEVVVPQNKILMIQEFVGDVVRAKQLEQHHQIDSGQEYKRFYTGVLGEAALEILLDIPIIDYTVGHSKQYNVPDIQQYGIGIKTVEYGKFPVIFKHNTYGQIINLKASDNTVLVAGYAGPYILNELQDESLILSPALRARGTKTCFYGFNALIKLGKINIARMVGR